MNKYLNICDHYVELLAFLILTPIVILNKLCAAPLSMSIMLLGNIMNEQTATALYLNSNAQILRLSFNVWSKLGVNCKS